jgi:hypothetical protein
MCLPSHLNVGAKQLLIGHQFVNISEPTLMLKNRHIGV